MTANEAMLLILLFFIGYNKFIDVFHARHPDGKGLIFLEVIGGVLAVLIIMSFITKYNRWYIPWKGTIYYLNNAQSASWLTFRMFVAAGIPMSIGAILRYVNNLVK